MCAEGMMLVCMPPLFRLYLEVGARSERQSHAAVCRRGTPALLRVE